MKLYYTPGACSLSPHIVLRELGLPFALERVDLATKTTESGQDYKSVNPKGYVPALELDNGAVLTEGPAIIQYLADSNGATHLAPQPGTLERARLQEYLNFIATELHKSFAPLFLPSITDDAKVTAVANITRRFDHVEVALSDGRPFLLGDTFTLADAYLFVIVNWARPHGINLDLWSHLLAFTERVRSRPAVKAALAAEGVA